MTEMTAPALLRQNLETISEKDREKWNTQRALLLMAEMLEELKRKQDRMQQDMRELRSMVERAVHR